MATQKEIRIAYGLAIILFIVGVFSFAAFPQKKPDEPIRILFKNIGGKVLFSHSVHTADYGASCQDCHHNIEDESGTYNADESYGCSECHEAASEDEDMPKRSDAMHQNCIGCHKENEVQPTECRGCHAL